MKKISVFILLALFAPLVASASSYTYDCESDQNGIEAFCLALPSKMPTSGAPSKTLSEGTQSPIQVGAAEPPEKELESAHSAPLIFGALDANLSATASTRPAVSPKAQSSQPALQAMRIQDGVRQVETFLLPLRDANPGRGNTDLLPSGTR